MSKTRWFRPLDTVPALLCAVTAAVLFLLPMSAAKGGAVRIKTPTEELVLPLDTDTVCTIEGNGGLQLIVTVKDGKAQVSQADCPDRLCIHAGALSKTGHTAACLPAGVVITVEGTAEEPVAPDAVAR